MSEATYAIPTLREELDRKVMDTLEWLVLGRQRGRLTELQFSAGIDTLFMAVSGLVGEEFIHMITEAQSLAGANKVVLKRHFKAPTGDKIMSFAWTPGEDSIYITDRVVGIPVGGAVKGYINAETAARMFNGVDGVMKEKGWIEL